MTSEGCSEGRGTFFLGHSGNLFLLTSGKDDLYIFDKCSLLIVCDTALLPSLSFPSRLEVDFIQPFLIRSFEVFKSFENISSSACFFFCLPSHLVGRQGDAQEAGEKENCDWIFSASWKETCSLLSLTLPPPKMLLKIGRISNWCQNSLFLNYFADHSSWASQSTPKKGQEAHEQFLGLWFVSSLLGWWTVEKFWLWAVYWVCWAMVIGMGQEAVLKLSDSAEAMAAPAS